MGLIDTFSAEDRVGVKFSDFYNLVKGCTERDMLLNGVRTETPHKHILQIMTGERQDAEKDDIDGTAEN